jgi:ribonuclease HI
MNLTIFTDGGSRGNPGLAAGAFVVYDETQHVLHQEGLFLGQKTNNEAEYEAFLGSVVWLKKNVETFKITQVAWKLDSLLVVEQLRRNWKVKEARMQELAQKIWQGLTEIGIPYSITHVPRAMNAAADKLVNETLDGERG